MSANFKVGDRIRHKTVRRHECATVVQEETDSVMPRVRFDDGDSQSINADAWEIAEPAPGRCIRCGEAGDTGGVYGDSDAQSCERCYTAWLGNADPFRTWAAANPIARETEPAPHDARKPLNAWVGVNGFAAFCQVWLEATPESFFIRGQILETCLLIGELKRLVVENSSVTLIAHVDGDDYVIDGRVERWKESPTCPCVFEFRGRDRAQRQRPASDTEPALPHTITVTSPEQYLSVMGHAPPAGIFDPPPMVDVAVGFPDDSADRYAAFCEAVREIAESWLPPGAKLLFDVVEPRDENRQFMCWARIDETELARASWPANVQLENERFGRQASAFARDIAHAWIQLAREADARGRR